MKQQVKNLTELDILDSICTNFVKVSVFLSMLSFLPQVHTLKQKRFLIYVTEPHRSICLYTALLFRRYTIQIPEDEKDRQENKNNGNPMDDPYAAHGSRITTTPVSMNSFSAVVAETGTTPTSR